MSDDYIITITDIRRAGFCARGIYDLAKRHGWTREDFQNFIRNGKTVSELKELGEDALLDRVIENKRRASDGG